MGLKCEKAYTDADLRHFQDALYVLNGKWKIAIIRELGSGHTRFTELKNRLPPITSRMLSKELKELESNHLIAKKLHEDTYPSFIEYEFTEYSKALAPLIDHLIEWASGHRKKLFAGVPKSSDRR